MKWKYGMLALLLGAFCVSWTSSKKEVKLKVVVVECADNDSIFLFQFDGILFRKSAASAIQSNVATFSLPATGPQFYYVGLASNNAKPIILGNESEVMVEAPCGSFAKAMISNSPLNQNYAEVKEQMNQLRGQTTGLIREFQRVANDEEARGKVIGKMQMLDEQKKSFLAKTRKEHPYLGEVVALNTYLSFQNAGAGYPNEVDYFVSEYFQFADWKNNDYNYLAWVYEGFRSYANTLSQIRIPNEIHQQYLESQLGVIPNGSRTYKLALGGILSVLQEKAHPNYSHFADLFLEKYGTKDPEGAARINTVKRQIGAFTEGGEAPDFAQATPDGEDFKLSSLRGKVVLIDFWASWCGPCRRENPNVVRVYEKYKDRGFEILSVSLDSSRDRWLNAIEADQLTWHHVSDLKGWKNEVAQIYGVRSIPQTFLLDAKGRIIAKNLRGPQLEAKLAEIFTKP